MSNEYNREIKGIGRWVMGVVSTLVVKDWVKSFQKSLVLKESDLKFILSDVVLALSWDYDGARDKLSVMDVEDYLVDAFSKLKSVNGVDEVVIVVGGVVDTISHPSSFLVVVDRCFGLENVMEQVKERWERGGHVVPWWYEEKLVVFGNWLCYVVAKLAGIYSDMDEVKGLYVRRSRGRLKVFLWVVISEDYVEWHDDWEEYDDGIEVLSKLRQVEREVRSLFPMVEFGWMYIHEREVDDFGLGQVPGIELVKGEAVERENVM